MLNKLNAWWQKPASLVVLTSIVMAVFMPLFFKLVHLAVAWRVGLLFLVLNSAYAWWLGRTIKSQRLPWWLMLLFPLLFAGMVLWRYADYSYWFVPVYLVLSLLALAKD